MKNVDWVVIHISRTEAEANRLEARLSEEGFLIRQRARPQLNIWELMATRLESVPARDFLIEILHEEEK